MERKRYNSTIKNIAVKRIDIRRFDKFKLSMFEPDYITFNYVLKLAEDGTGKK